MPGLLSASPVTNSFGRGREFVKSATAADDTDLSYAMSGRLYASGSGWVLLSVPNAFVRGAFDAMAEPGVELPPSSDGRLNAHISVMRKEEVESLGGPDVITERGHVFRYTLGPIRSVKPIGWTEMERVWFVRVQSPELEKLRKSYGLPPLPTKDGRDLHFHITLAVRRKKVLQNNDVRKAAADLDGEQRELFDQGHGVRHWKCGHTTSCRCQHGSNIEVDVDDVCPDCRMDKEALLGDLASQVFQASRPFGPQNHSYSLEALQDQPFLAGSLSGAQQLAKSRVNAAQQIPAFRADLDPQYRIQRAINAMQGQYDTPQVGWLDQLLMSVPLGKLAEAIKAARSPYRYRTEGRQQMMLRRKRDDNGKFSWQKIGGVNLSAALQLSQQEANHGEEAAEVG